MTFYHNKYCKPSIAKREFAHFAKLEYQMKNVYVIKCQENYKVELCDIREDDGCGCESESEYLALIMYDN